MHTHTRADVVEGLSHQARSPFKKKKRKRKAFTENFSAPIFGVWGDLYFCFVLILFFIFFSFRFLYGN